MRMQSVWRSTKTALFKENEPGFLRVQESAHWRLITYEMDVLPSELKTVFTQIKRKGYTCRSIKLFFEGTLPDLTSFGYQSEDCWYVFPHLQIDISAVPYGKHEWCLLIEKRTGHGVPMHVLDHIPIYQEDHQTTIWEANSS